MKKTKPEELSVRCGEWHLDSENEHFKHQDRFVASISRHPKYFDPRQIFLHNDLALIHLTEDFVLTEHLDTVCLPENVFDRENNYEKFNCAVMGWDHYDIMKEVTQLHIVDNDQCEERYREYFGTWVLHKSFLCAGKEEGVDSFDHFAGGPLVCPKPEANDR